MTKYKTEKRKANVGERILITEASYALGKYRNGDVLTVESNYGYGGRGIFTKELGDIQAPFIDHDEYEVIIEDAPSPKLLTRLFNAEAEIDELQRKVKALESEVGTLKKANVPKMPRIEIDTKSLGDLISKRFAEASRRLPTLSPNQRRADVIKRAQAFVADLKADLITTKITFHVNAEKGVVTALAQSTFSGSLVGKAFARCAPGDVFNADIGKAIAAGRLYGVDIPKEFTDAPKPTEVVEGMRVENTHKKAIEGGWGFGKVTKFSNGVFGSSGYTVEDGSWALLKDAEIIEDTDAKYETALTR